MNLNTEKIGKYIQRVIYNLLPFEDQFCIFQDGFYWCDDWEEIEKLKYLYVGKKKYFEYPVPYRANSNPLFLKERVEEYCENLLKVHSEIESSTVNNLLIVEPKRGIDLLIASMYKDWDKVFIVSNNRIQEGFLIREFSNLKIASIPTDSNLKVPVVKILNTGNFLTKEVKTWNTQVPEN